MPPETPQETPAVPPTPTPLPNSPEARTPTGELKDPAIAAKESSTTSTPTPENKEGEPKAPEAPKPEGAPEKYEAFKVPENFEIPEAQNKEITDTFKSLGLSQDQAQKLVDLYAKNAQEAAEAPFKMWMDTQEKWRAEITNDPDVGKQLPQVKETIGRALDSLGDPGLTKAFKETMDFTGAGNNLAFVKVFWKLAQQLTEGRPAEGGRPSAFGQQAPKAGPITPAKALYPHLP